jgi:CubicO group peptidase (beta-lactamase class C family)
MKMTKSLFVLAAAIALCTVSLGCASTPESMAIDALSARERFEQVSGRGAQQSIEELLDQRRVPGVSVAVIEGFTLAWTAGYGIADVVSGAAVTPETLFQAASISKPVAAMAAVRAVQDGMFGLDDDINALLTSWRLPSNEFTEAQPVTPRRLLSHTAGTTVHGFPGYHPDAAMPTVPQLLNGEDPANTDAVVVDTKPGTIWRYSGGGTTIMQVAMGDVFAKPFPEIVKTLVLEPAGMTHSGYDQPLPTERDRLAARAHDGRGEAMDAKWHVYPELEAAGLWTTSADLCRFAIALMEAYRGTPGSVISQESARLMVTPVEPGSFAVGLSISERSDGTWAGHGGSNWGFRCDLGFNVERGYGYCIMTNGEGGGAVVSELKRRLFSVYGWSDSD